MKSRAAKKRRSTVNKSDRINKTGHTINVATKLTPLLRPKTIEQLPSSVLTLIMRYVPCKELLIIQQRVNKTINKAATDASALSSITFNSHLDLQWFITIKQYQYDKIESVTINPNPLSIQKDILLQLNKRKNVNLINKSKIRYLHLKNISLTPEMIRFINSCCNNIQVLSLTLSPLDWGSAIRVLEQRTLTARMGPLGGGGDAQRKVNPADILESVKQLRKFKKLKVFKTCILFDVRGKPSIDWLNELVTHKLNLKTIEKVILHDCSTQEEEEEEENSDEDLMLHPYGYDHWVYPGMRTVFNINNHPTARTQQREVLENQLLNLMDALSKHNNIDSTYFNGLKLGIERSTVTTVFGNKSNVLKLFKMINKLVYHSKNKTIEEINIEIRHKRDPWEDDDESVRINICKTREYFLLAMEYLQQVFKSVNNGGDCNGGDGDAGTGAKDDTVCPKIGKITVQTSFPDQPWPGRVYGDITPGSVSKSIDSKKTNNNNNNNKEKSNDTCEKLELENESVVPWSKLVIEMAKWQAKLYNEKIITIEKLDVDFQYLDRHFGADPRRCIPIRRDIDKVLTACENDFSISSCSMEVGYQQDEDDPSWTSDVFVFHSYL